jgi:hypothetical protein
MEAAEGRRGGGHHGGTTDRTADQDALTHRTNGGATWTTPVLLDPVGENPSVALNAAGNALIAYDKGFGLPTWFIRAK